MLSILNERFVKNYGSIQSAFNTNDTEMSRKEHDRLGNRDSSSYIEEYHKIIGSDVIKSIIYGGLDGIITTFSIICSSYASKLSIHTIMVLGFANVLADAISMGHGDYFSEKTEIDYINTQYAREKWEMEHYPEGELNEMINIYEKKYNIDYGNARQILTSMSKYPELFIDHMMVLELDLMPPDNNNNPYKNGFITFFSFLFFGCVPLIVFILSSNIYYAIVATILTLGLLGWTRSYFTKSNKCYSCIITIFNGCISAGSAYGVSYALDYYL